MKLSDNGIDVTLEFDEDGFPLVAIDTNDGYLSEGDWPTVEVSINDRVVHPMFAGELPDELEFLQGLLTYVEDGNVIELRECGFVRELQGRIKQLTSRVPIDTVYVSKVTVTDPDSQLPVELEIRKLATGGMVGLDGSWLESDMGPAYSPYDCGVKLSIPDDEATPVTDK